MLICEDAGSGRVGRTYRQVDRGQVFHWRSRSRQDCPSGRKSPSLHIHMPAQSLSIVQTHNVNMVVPIADFVVSLGSDGQILSQGTMSDALAKNSKLRQEIAKEKAFEEKAEQEEAFEAFEGATPDQVVPAQKEEKKDGKLILEEETAEGHISWNSSEFFSIYIHWALC